MAMMFLMPMALIFIMVIVQDEPFRDYQEHKIPIIILDADMDSLGNTLTRGLMNSPVFEAVLLKGDNSINQLRNSVRQGEYKVGIIISKDASKILRTKISAYIKKVLEGLDMEISKMDSSKVELIFDPVIKKSFRSTVTSNLEKHIARIELKIMLDMFAADLKELLPNVSGMEFANEEMVYVIERDKELNMMNKYPIFNSVQHNVPAYTVFGIFFIVITMASNMIKERDEGSEARLNLIPNTFWPIILGRISAYVFVIFIQAWLMFSVGIFLLPLLGFPELQLNGSFLAINIVILAIGLAATGFGYLIGTIFNTHQQSAVFGAVSVVIMSALGGVWVPIFVMPEFVQSISGLFPVSWGLQAFNDLFLRQAEFAVIMPRISYLILFFCGCLIIALIKNKNSFSGK